MQLNERKNLITQKLLLINNHQPLDEIEQMIDRIVKEQSKLNSTKKRIKKISFQEWNSQFNTSPKELNQFIPECGMTLLEFRKKIYKAEMSKSISYDSFKKELRNWKKKNIE